MERTQPKFLNDTFKRLFDRNINFKFTKLLEGVNHLKDLTQYIILDYKLNRDAHGSYRLVKEFDAVIKLFLAHFGEYKMNEKEQKALVEMASKFKTDPTVAKIRFEGQSQNNSTDLKQDSNDDSENKPETKEVEPEEFNKIFDEMKNEFQEHRIENAYELREKLLKRVETLSPDNQNKNLFTTKLKENERLIQEIENWYKEVQKILSEMNNEEGYVEDTGIKGYVSKYKALPDGRCILKMEGPLKMPLFNILTLMYEADGFGQWIPFCSAGKMIKPLYRASHVYWMKYGLPPPLTNRECHCFGYGSDRFERNGSILLISRSIDDDPEFLKYHDIQIPKESKLVKMQIEVATEFVPLNKDEMIMRQITTVNPNVKNAPPFVMTWISRKIGQHMFETLIKKAKNLKGTIWEKEIQKNPEFYAWLDQKVNKFLNAHELI